MIKMLFKSGLVVLCGLQSVYPAIYSDDFREYNDFVTKYFKSYDLVEKVKRYEIFHNNTVFIRKHNNNSLSNYNLTTNYLSDYNDDEYRQLLGYLPQYSNLYQTNNVNQLSKICQFNLDNISYA